MTRRPIVTAAEIVALLGLFLAACATTNRANIHDPRLPHRSRRPNILLLLTDDQDVIIGGTEHMPLLQKHLTQKGASFVNYFVHTPVCCPSRSSILTGKYLHNIPMTNNSVRGNCYGQAWQDGPEHNTFAVYAQQAGYQTAFAGKYLNQYGTAQGHQGQRPGGNNGCIHGTEKACRRVPPGWDRWMGLVGNSVYYNYSLVVADEPGGNNVTVESHGMDYDMDYLPNILANRTMESIEMFAKNDDDDDAPFLIMLAWPTPHDPFTPAPVDQGTFTNARAHRTPNWNTTQAQTLVYATIGSD